MTSLPPTIGRYRVEGIIGKGAMGVVYRAHDPDIDRKVAIKLVLAELLEAEGGDEFLLRFRREAQAAARCSHPNIVAVYDLAMHEGCPFIAMEYVEGASLAQHLSSRQPMKIDDAVAIALQILAALAGAHGFGIVHRDIKPGNILITPDGRVKVTDFGVARLALSDLTQSGAMVGTLSYMSPEQCRGDEIDARSDLFSVACILHEMLLGARPFPGRTQAEVMRRLLADPPAGLAEASIPAALRDVIATGLEKSADRRFASAAAMADALRAAAGDTGAGDRTVVQTRQAPVAQNFDPALLSDMERHLTRYLGPIARALVSSAARRADSLEALRDLLASGIEQPTERARFLRDSAGPATSPGPVTTTKRPATAAIPAETAALAQRALARALGPIASVLVKRTLAQATSPDDFWARLATHIDNAAAREAFLKSRP